MTTTPPRTAAAPDETLDGSEAVARTAYRLSEVIAIYPITPASAMAEFGDQWATEQRPNLEGIVPEVIEMQSEAGAAGTLHGTEDADLALSGGVHEPADAVKALLAGQQR